MVVSVLQWYKTDTNTSMGWQINILSDNEIGFITLNFKLSL